MDDEGFQKWLDGTPLKRNSQEKAISLCREIEPLIEPIIGNLEEVVCDKTKMEDALDWLMDHADEYVLKGRLKREGVASKRWALRKYARFVHFSKANSAKATLLTFL
jgi:hypothetical protein